MKRTLVLVLVGWLAAAARAETPNVVLILVDDMGWGDLGCYGSALHETPNIDRLATEGMRFTDAYAAGPVCSPTRASLLTGRTPAALNITDWIPGRRYPAAPLASLEFTQELPLDETTTAELLGAGGYTCLHVGKWHLGSEPYWPRKQGFDVNVGGHDKGAPATYFHPYQSKNEARVDWGVKNLPPGGVEGDYLTDRLTREAIGLLETHRDEPFFLYLSFYAVHTPIEGRPDLVEHYRAKAPELGERKLAYAAMVHAVDENVGRVLAALERLDLSERTLVILTSDNGGVVGIADNGPLRAGKGFLFEGGIRVPLIVRWSGHVPAGATCDAVASSIDLHPTILAAAGVEPAAPIEGIDLGPVLADPAAMLDRDAVHFHYPHYHTPKRPPSGAIRAGDLKLIEYFEDGRVELYDLAADPAEQHDLAARRPGEAAALRERLEAWRRRVGAVVNEPNPDHDPEAPFKGGYTPWDAKTPSGE